ncbi:hypothetical protein P4B35_20575 [Pontiellaceae bacterium B12227]|nr:hypothetical protein [Pontiellaceae bacterium B12227]
MTRYEDLLSLYLDGEPTEAELNELAELLKNDQKLAVDFREELLIWEAWSQETVPERSAEAFLAGFHTRLRAEDDAGDFELMVTKQLKERRNPFLWQPIFAIAAVLVILLSLSVIFNPADIHTGLVATAEAGTVHIHGECVCMHCTLNKADRCRKALRYTDENGTVHLIPMKKSECLQQHKGCFCRGPTPVLIEGKLVEENGEKMLIATSLVIEEEKSL